MPESADCVMCQDPLFAGNGLGKEGPQHPRRIAELDVSTAVLHPDWQLFRGATLLVFQDHQTELHHLQPDLRHRFADDACRIAGAMERAFSPWKLNHAMLGNFVPHLHWHLIPRQEDDPSPPTSIWEFDFPKLRPSDAEFQQIADEIRRHL